MERTERSKFLVKRRTHTSVFSTSPNTTHWWFKAIQTKNEDKVRIPLLPREYDKEMYDKLQSLSHGDVVEAVLEREDEHSSWKPIELEKVDHRDNI